MSKQVELPIEVARDMYNSSNKDLKAFALANYTKEELEAKELPKTWRELNRVKGWYITNDSIVTEQPETTANLVENANIFATEEQAKASIAMAQLSQLMQVYNDGWIHNASSRAYVIYYAHGIMQTGYNNYEKRFLSFEKPEIRDEFAINFKDLIKQAKPLL